MTWQPRHAILLILFAAYLLCYMDRMLMATALPFVAKDFGLSPLAMGGVLSAFFLGYSMMQIPGGLLADRFGPRRVLIASVVGWSCFTAWTGTAGSLAAMLIIRTLFGVSEGPFPSAASKTIALWFPQREVGRANGLQLAAVNVGAAFAPLLIAPLILQFGWRFAFYSLLMPGLLLALLVCRVIQDAPARLDDEECSHPRSGSAAGIGIRQMMKTPAVLWCAATLFLGNIAGWGLMNWLPTYLLEARGFSVTRMGFFASLPYLAGAVGYYLGGHISDKYFSSRRHIPIVLGLTLGGVMTYAAAIAPSGEWAVAALVLAFLFVFISSAGTFTLPLVLVPKAAVGSAFGIVNTAGQLAAFLSPLLAGWVLNVTHGDFALLFYCIVGLFILAACIARQIRQPDLALAAAASP
jgi:sugar phosphate permease